MFNHPYFLLMLAPLIWGGHGVVGKIAAADIAPMTLALLRWLSTILILLPFAIPAVKKDWEVIKANLLRLALYGAVGFAAFNMLNYKSLHYTTALNTTLLQAFIPMLILLINWLFFRQALIAVQIIGLLLALLGVIIIISEGRWQTLATLSFNRGDLLMLLACLMYAIYSIGLRSKPDISWLSFIFVLAVAACLTVLPFAGYEMTQQNHVVKLSWKTIFLVIYVSLFASIIAQIAYAKGVGLIGANRAGFALNLVPVFGSLLAVFFLGEAFRWFHLVGLLAVLAGIYLSERLIKH